jgi:hypothetical protein
MADEARRLVTGRQSHEIYVVEGNTKRYVPDLWTMQAEGLSPANLEVLDEEALHDLPSGTALRSQVPAPQLEDRMLVETENGLYVVRDGSLQRVGDISELLAQDGFDPNRAQVTYLPLALLRTLLSPAVGGEG